MGRRPMSEPLLLSPSPAVPRVLLFRPFWRVSLWSLAQAMPREPGGGSPTNGPYTGFPVRSLCSAPASSPFPTVPRAGFGISFRRAACYSSSYFAGSISVTFILSTLMEAFSLTQRKSLFCFYEVFLREQRLMSVFSLSPLTRALKFLETKEASSQGKDWKSSLQLLQSLCALVRNP